jgi:hypothetical protein
MIFFSRNVVQSFDPLTAFADRTVIRAFLSLTLLERRVEPSLSADAKDPTAAPVSIP